MIPRSRAVWLAAVSIIPAAVALLAPWLAPALVVFDALVLSAIVADFVLAPSKHALRVRRIVSIGEGGGFAPQPVPMMKAMAMDAAGAAPPVAPGETTVGATLQVVFELGR